MGDVTARENSLASLLTCFCQLGRVEKFLLSLFFHRPVLMIFIMQSAPPEANSGIMVGHAANASVPSSYFRLCAAMSCRSWKVRMSHTRTAPSWPPDTIKFG